jgi:glycosyltransferase involved in cell wall biosynthesis
MKIAIASMGRAHLLETARELAKLGHDVSFYSYVPRSRCEKFGLDKKYVKGCFLVSSVIEFVCRKLPFSNRTKRKIRFFNRLLMDYMLAVRLQRCDIFISVTGVGYYVKSLITAKKKYGAILLLDCGCKHTQEKYNILRKTGRYTQISQQTVRKELSGYQLADYIIIPSEHSYQSFLKHNFPKEKLFVNPYGVSLERFHATDKPPADSYDVIIVGQWCYRKGCDLLTDACLHILGKKLLHVGSVIDCPLPDHHLFTHIDAVDESHLMNYYAQAKIFVLPSREDGFGLVLSQALACGLPIVCSKDTGGRDLRNFLNDKKWIIEMPRTTAECLAECIRDALILADSQSEGKRNYVGAAVKHLTWEAYGKRYDSFLQQITK